MKHLKLYYSMPETEDNNFDDRTLASLVGMEAAVDDPTVPVDEFLRAHSGQKRGQRPNGGSR